jgi:SAM-dependent methyltransferase
LRRFSTRSACVLGRISSRWRPDPGSSQPRLHAAGRKSSASIYRRGWSNWRRLHPGVDFREAEVEHLPFADRTFDAVVCSFGLGHFPQPEAAVAECVRTIKPGGRIALSWWDDPARQRIQGLFRETIAELAVTLPPDLPQAHNSYRFSDTEEFLRLLRGAGLVDVALAEHATSYCVPDVETLWRGGLGSCVLTGAAIRHQDEATQKRIRAAFERRASVYKSANGLDLPVAFKVGSGRRPI